MKYLTTSLKLFIFFAVAGFADNSVTIGSPLNNEANTLRVNVVRTGGTFGIVEIKWNATANGNLSYVHFSCYFTQQKTVYFPVLYVVVLHYYYFLFLIHGH